MMFTFVFWQQG